MEKIVYHVVPPLEPLRPPVAHGGGVRRVHQSNPMASGHPSFAMAISSDTYVIACVAITTICLTACSVIGLLRTVTPAALLPLPEAARALPGLISCRSDELLYIAEVPYPLNGTSTRMQQLGWTPVRASRSSMRTPAEEVSISLFLLRWFICTKLLRRSINAHVSYNLDIHTLSILSLA